MTSMLRAEGFTNIQHVFDLDRLQAAIRSEKPHAAVIEVDGLEVEIFALTRALRTPAFPGDPFLPILVTESAVTLENARRFSFAGVDAILSKPISPASILKHLTDIAHHPREFVISGSYAGPEHRHAPREENQIARLLVQNTLALLFDGEMVDKAATTDSRKKWSALLKAHHNLYAKPEPI